jgi:hypothetical protein
VPEDTASVGSYARHADWVTRKSELRRLNLGQNEPWKLGICYPNHDGVLRSAWQRRQRPRYTFKIADNLLALFTDGGYHAHRAARWRLGYELSSAFWRARRDVRSRLSLCHASPPLLPALLTDAQRRLGEHVHARRIWVEGPRNERQPLQHGVSPTL